MLPFVHIPYRVFFLDAIINYRFASSTLSVTPAAVVARFELLEGTGATHVPDQINVRKPLKTFISVESDMLQFGFGRVVTTISRLLIDKCRYVDFSSTNDAEYFSVLEDLYRSSSVELRHL